MKWIQWWTKQRVQDRHAPTAQDKILSSSKLNENTCNQTADTRSVFCVFLTVQIHHRARLAPFKVLICRSILRSATYLGRWRVWKISLTYNNTTTCFTTKTMCGDFKVLFTFTTARKKYLAFATPSMLTIQILKQLSKQLLVVV